MRRKQLTLRTPGHEFVGEIVEKGDAVKKFNIGDKVLTSLTPLSLFAPKLTFSGP